MLANETAAGLAIRAKAGDQSALDYLIRRLEPKLYRITRAVAGIGTWTAEEALQEALIDVVGGIRDLEDPDAVESWARTIAIRRAVALYRRDLRHGRTDIDPDLIGRPIDHTLLAVIQAMQILPPRQRAVAGLRLLGGLTEAETAEALGVELGTVKYHFSVACKRLRAELG